MTIPEFIKNLIQAMPNREEVSHKYESNNRKITEKELDTYFLNNSYKLNEKFNDYQIGIDQLIYKTNISDVGLGAINFNHEIKIVEDKYRWFATYNDFFKIVADGADRIYILSESSRPELFASSFEAFLQFLLLYSKYERVLIWQGKRNIIRFKPDIERLANHGFSSDWLLEFFPDVFNKSSGTSN